MNIFRTYINSTKIQEFGFKMSNVSLINDPDKQTEDNNRALSFRIRDPGFERNKKWGV